MPTPTNGDRKSGEPTSDEKQPLIPHAASESVVTRRGFGDLVIRPLGPAIRSQTVVQDGVTTIVLNSQHPLFRERKGDMWYQLETAAAEICKSVEGVTLAEYERRVNEIVLLAFRLRRQRKKPKTPAAQLKILT
jgi:hypothetical protein